MESLKIPLKVRKIHWEKSTLQKTFDAAKKIAICSSDEILWISEHSVYWLKGLFLDRYFHYDEVVINAFFTSFSVESSDDRKLVVVLENAAHIYYADGQKHTMSFSYQITNAYPFEGGFVIDRCPGSGSCFLAVTDPMSDPGAIVSSSTSLIASTERLLLFPQRSDSTIAVTRDKYEQTISLYHTRFLNRSSKSISHNPVASKKRVPSQSFRISSHSSSTNDQGEGNFDNGIMMEKRRNVSQAENMAIDRMASYDTNMKTAETMSTTTPLDVMVKKDAILSKLETLQFKSDSDQIKIQSVVFDDKESVIIRDQLTGFFQCFIFHVSKSVNPFPRLVKTIDLSGQYVDFGVCSSTPGLCIFLSKSNDFVLCNPALQLSTSLFTTSFHVDEICDANGSTVILKDSNCCYGLSYLPINPKSVLVKRCLSCLKYITNSYTFNYIWLTFLNACSIDSDEWSAFVLTVLVTILPFAVKPTSVSSPNLVSSLLAKIVPLQMRAIGDGFALYEMAPNIVTALHLIREDLKLDILENDSVDKLGFLLAQLSHWMSWPSTWKSAYNVDESLLDNSLRFPSPPLLDEPPDLLRSLTSLFDSQIVPFCTFSQLAQEDEEVDATVTSRTYAVLRLFEALISSEFSPLDIVRMLGELKISLEVLETFPIGIVIPLKEVTSYCQEHLASMDQSPGVFGLLDRKDLEVIRSHQHKRIHKYSANSHIQAKDTSQIVNTIWKSPDHIAPIEQDRLDITRTIFKSDRRFWEMTKILESSQVQRVTSTQNTAASDKELLEYQKEVAHYATVRLLTLSIGKSIVFYSMKSPLTTEIFPFWKMNFATTIYPDDITITTDKDSLDKVSLEWAYFHNGAAGGLTVSKDAKGITGSWITFNRNKSLTAQHAGFLLGLGLNGHLKSLEEWNIFNYLGPKHSYTSIGLLLGMSASLKRTMDTKLTKVLSVHLDALLPQGASDLIVGSSVQSAGLIGIGLLYLETQHRRMTEILLSQVNGKVHVEGKTLSDESYRLSAGIALGYVNLGKANELKNLKDTRVIDHLLEITTSLRDVQSSEAYDKSIGGALIALMFIYLKSHDKEIVKKLAVPETEQVLDYERPDLLILRALATNLIMWNDIGDTEDWVKSQIPAVVLSKRRSSVDLIDQSDYYYIVAGVCLSVGVKYASTSNLIARDTIIHFYDDITKKIDDLHGDESFEAIFARPVLQHVQGCLAIAMSLVMSGTGDLDVFRRLRIVHGKLNNLSGAIAYGKFMAINMALGFLFLGGGQYAINTLSNFSIAALVTSIYPIFPNTEGGVNETHLQALRHFWAMAVDPRCLVTRDVESFDIVEADVCLEFKDGSTQVLRTPNILPPVNDIAKISLESFEYFNISVSGDEFLQNRGQLFLYKRQGINVMKHSVKVLLDEINAKFEQKDKTSSYFYDLDLFKGFKKDDIRELIGRNQCDMKVNIVDRQIELSNLVKNPRNIDDLWNLKLVFSYYDRALQESDTHYLSLEFIDDLRNVLWGLYN